MATVTIIEATTAAAIAEFTVSGEMDRVVLACAGLDGVETVSIKYQVGTTWIDVILDGAAAELTATDQVVVINGQGRYKVTKVTTVGDTEVQITY